MLGARCSVPGARCPVPGARCPVPGARCPVPGASMFRFLVPGSPGASVFWSMQRPYPPRPLVKASSAARHASTSGGSPASARASARFTSITR
ncbi:hypothetical protein EGT41_11390 [Burkholderia cenocepacia]|uniref:Uncharacterized protein n=1 Tax=Burkholderia cenocepacia TaxID=95486 RepID=A0A427P228_9BURK|nr:hypothetical protein EGT41_11390 [Burkholderia cenocepacia]